MVFRRHNLAESLRSGTFFRRSEDQKAYPELLIGLLASQTDIAADSKQFGQSQGKKLKPHAGGKVFVDGVLFTVYPGNAGLAGDEPGRTGQDELEV